MGPITRPLAVGRVRKHFSLGILVCKIDDLEEVIRSEIQMRLTDGDVIGFTVHADVVDTDLVLWAVAVVLTRDSWRLDCDVVIMVDKWRIVFTAFIPLHDSPD